MSQKWTVLEIELCSTIGTIFTVWNIPLGEQEIDGSEQMTLRLLWPNPLRFWNSPVTQHQGHPNNSILSDQFESVTMWFVPNRGFASFFSKRRRSLLNYDALSPAAISSLCCSVIVDYILWSRCKHDSVKISFNLTVQG